MAAAVALRLPWCPLSGWHRRILKLANMLCNKSMSLKLENIIVLIFIRYFNAQYIINMPSLRMMKNHAPYGLSQ